MLECGPPTEHRSGAEMKLLPNGTYLRDEDYTSLKLVRAPKWQANFTAEYTIPLGSAGDLTARGSVLYKSTYYNTVTNDAAGIAGEQRRSAQRAEPGIGGAGQSREIGKDRGAQGDKINDFGPGQDHLCRGRNGGCRCCQRGLRHA